MICPECNTRNTEGNTKCSHCGCILPMRDEIDSIAGMKTVVSTDTIEDILKKGTLFAGRYELLNDGLKGGMGAVYKVKDNTLEKIKALKIILPQYLGNEKAVSRFKQEVAITQDLQHENIVRVFDIGESEGVLFFTMEWIDGISLRDYITERKKQNNKLSYDEIKYFAGQICPALSYAHKTIIHRDIKPENILVIDPFSKTPKVKITDFGIAKVGSQSLHQSTSSYMGTPIYMAPEQYTEAHNVDKRADVYSVGVVLYELSTFLHPLGTFPMPSEVNPSIPAKVDEIIRKTLHTDKTRRYEDVLDIVKDLEMATCEPRMKQPLRVEQPAYAPVPPQTGLEGAAQVRMTQKADSRASKKIPLAIVGAVLAVILLIGGVFSYNSYSKAKEERLQREKEQAEKLATQQEGLRYFQEGKDFFDKKKYELCIEKMKEALKRDSSNNDAGRYISMAYENLAKINPRGGTSGPGKPGVPPQDYNKLTEYYNKLGESPQHPTGYVVPPPGQPTTVVHKDVYKTVVQKPKVVPPPGGSGKDQRTFTKSSGRDSGGSGDKHKEKKDKDNKPKKDKKHKG